MASLFGRAGTEGDGEGEDAAHAATSFFVFTAAPICTLFAIQKRKFPAF